jgi:lipocalin-like protein
MLSIETAPAGTGPPIRVATSFAKIRERKRTMSIDYLGPLVGSRRLDSLSAIFTDNGERVETFGPNPSRRMVLTPGGRIAFLIMRSDRRTPIDDTQRAAQFISMAAYSGVVRSDSPGQFITTVDVSLVPSEIGGEKLRLFSVDESSLTIRLPAQIDRFGKGRRRVPPRINVLRQMRCARGCGGAWQWHGWSRGQRSTNGSGRAGWRC